MKIVVDGYNAPVTAGAFVDLVEKKFYDGMEVQRSDGLVVQTGRPEGDVSHCSLNVLHLNFSPSLPFLWSHYLLILLCCSCCRQ
jgi:cyclophilin family peptidyl-prolyl cis-trans isomerase